MKIFALLFLVALSASVIGSRADGSDCDYMIEAFTMCDLNKIPKPDVQFLPAPNFKEKMTTGPVKLSKLHTIVKEDQNTMVVKFTDSSKEKNNFEASLVCDADPTVTPGCRPTFNKLFTLDSKTIKKCQKNKRWKEAVIERGDAKGSITFTAGGVVSLIRDPFHPSHYPSKDLCAELVELITKCDPMIYRATSTVPDHVFTPNPKFLTRLSSAAYHLTLSHIHQVLLVPSRKGRKIALRFERNEHLQAELLFPSEFKEVEDLATNKELLTECRHGAAWGNAVLQKDGKGNVVLSANGKQTVIYEASNEASGGHSSRGHVSRHSPAAPKKDFLSDPIPEDLLPPALLPPPLAAQRATMPQPIPPIPAKNRSNHVVNSSLLGRHPEEGPSRSASPSRGTSPSPASSRPPTGKSFSNLTYGSL